MSIRYQAVTESRINSSRLAGCVTTWRGRTCGRSTFFQAASGNSPSFRGAGSLGAPGAVSAYCAVVRRTVPAAGGIAVSPAQTAQKTRLIAHETQLASLIHSLCLGINL